MTWIAYDIGTSEEIEQAYKSKLLTMDLSNTPVAIPNYVDFSGHGIKQVNKHTHYQREVQRLKNQNYPKDTLTLKTAGASTSNRVNTSTAVKGHLVSNHAVPSKVTVSRKGAKTVSTVKKTKKVKVEHSQGKVIKTLISFIVSYSTSVINKYLEIHKGLKWVAFSCKLRTMLLNVQIICLMWLNEI